MKKIVLGLLLLSAMIAYGGSDDIIYVPEAEPAVRVEAPPEAAEPDIIYEPEEPPELEGAEEIEEPEDAWWMEGAEHEAAEEPEVREPRSPRLFFCFLTGRQVSRAQQRKRPVSIIIDNLRQAQPTVGVGSADIIYEAIVEGGSTRLLMILADYEDVPSFGSVRSARDYYVDLSQSHDAIFVHAGGSESAYRQMFDRNIDRLDGVNRVDRLDGMRMHLSAHFYRDAARRRVMAFEHTLMTSGDRLVAGIRQAGYRTRHAVDFTGPFNFHAEFTELPEDSAAAYFVAVPFSAHFIPEFIFNPDDGLYYRRQFGGPHLDGATGEQLRFENVIVLFAEYRSMGTADGALACELVGTGFGFYISGGRFITIRWAKDSRDGPMRLFNLDHSDLYLNPGRSYIAVTSTSFNRSVIINAEQREIS